MNVKLLISVASAILLAAPAVRALEAEKVTANLDNNALQTRSLTGVVPSPLVMFGMSIAMGTLAIASREMKR